MLGESAAGPENGPEGRLGSEGPSGSLLSQGEAGDPARIPRMLRIAVAADEAARVGGLQLHEEARASILLIDEELDLWRSTGEAPAFCGRFLGLMAWYAEDNAEVRGVLTDGSRVDVAALAAHLDRALRAKRMEIGLPTDDASLMAPVATNMCRGFDVSGLGVSLTAAAIVSAIYQV